MPKLDKYSKKKLVEMVDKGNISLTEYEKYKSKLQKNIEDTSSRKAILKQQVQDLEAKPRIRDLNELYAWGIMAAGYGLGAATGLAAAAFTNSSLAAHLLGGFIGMEAGAGLAISSIFVYSSKPITNALTRAKIKHKNKEIAKNVEKQIYSEQRLQGLELEELASDLRF